jgi:hypothetical protein
MRACHVVSEPREVIVQREKNDFFVVDDEQA